MKLEENLLIHRKILNRCFYSLINLSVRTVDKHNITLFQLKSQHQWLF